MKPPAPELPPQLASWLNALEEARARSTEDYGKNQQKRIAYSFFPESRYDGGVSRLELVIHSTRRLKDGSLSPSARPYDPRSALTTPSRPNIFGLPIFASSA